MVKKTRRIASAPPERIFNRDCQVLVKLSDTDLAYRESCIQSGREFTDPFLTETRAQRLGISVAEFSSWPNYERARHLADEQFLMRQAVWQYEPPAYINWPVIEQRSVAAAEQFAMEFGQFREQKRKEMAEALVKSRKKR